MERLIRYGKKVTLAIVMTFVVAVTGILSTSFVSKAVGQSEDLTFHVNYTEPYCSEYCGYFSVVFGVEGDYRLNTFFWSIIPDEIHTEDSKDFLTVMDVSISGGKITFSPFVYGGNYYFNLYEFGSTDALAQDMSGYYNYANNPSWSYTYGANIVAYIFGGNVADVSAPTLDTPVIKWNNSPDAVELYDYLYQILSALNRVDIDTSDIISRLSDIYSQNVSINEKLYDLRWMLAEQLVMINDELDAIWYQLDDLIKGQEESNTWLGKIWDSIQEFFNPSDEEKTESEEFESETTEKTDEIGGLVEESKTEKPNVDEMSNSIDSNLDMTSANEYGAVLLNITENEYILQMLLIVVAVAIIAYVLFGKR